MKTSKEYKIQAKALMAPSWKIYGLGYLIFFAITMAVGFTYVGAFIIAGPFSLAFAIIGLKIISGMKIEIGDVFDGFKNFANAFFLYLRQMATIFLWTLLFFIPGILASFSYSMVFYILAENPDISSKEAMAESKRLMQGHKWELFCLELSFFGWALLTGLTFGILGIWLMPYMQTTLALFYADLKANNPHPEGLYRSSVEPAPQAPFEGGYQQFAQPDFQQYAQPAAPTPIAEPIGEEAQILVDDTDS